MKKFSLKKTLAMSLAAFSVFGVLFGTGCQFHQSFDNLVPEEYGEWDGNYIYRGNVRSKTTGESGEQIVTSVTIDGVSYSVSGCVDAASSGDDMFIMVQINATDLQTDSLGIRNCIVKYNVKDKTQDLIFQDGVSIQNATETKTYEVHAIERTTENGLLLYGYEETTPATTENTNETQSRNVWFTIDFNGNVIGIDEMNYYSYTRQSDDYFTRVETVADTTSLYYTTWGQKEDKFVADITPTATETVDVDFIDRGGVTGFLIAYYAAEKQTHSDQRLVSLRFYDVKTDTLSDFMKVERQMKWIESTQYGYFVAYDWGEVTYTDSENQKQTVEMQQNCELYEVDYDAEGGVKLNVVYEFEKDKDFSNIGGVADGKAYVWASWYASAFGCSGGGYQSEYYSLDLATKKLTKMKGDAYRETIALTKSIYAREQGAKCGDYTYYLQSEKLTTVLNSTTRAYMLQRYDATKKKVETMQLWKSIGTQDEKAKYCHMMWFNNGGDMFIVRNY